MIQSIKFSLMGPELIRKMSVAKIVTPDTHDADGYPIKGGLMDPRMGVVDPGLRCRTCRCRMGDCPGHFGHIELARPVLHVGYAKFVYEFLRGFCRKCGRIKIQEKEIKELQDAIEEGEKIELVAEAAVKSARDVPKCPHCGEKYIKINFEKPTAFFEDKDRLTPTDIRKRLEKVTEEDLQLIAIDPKVARPEWMILSILPVPPVTTRPSITLESGERSEDDLTHKLVDILRLNQRLAENIEAGAPQLILEDQWELVQYHVTTYLDNEVSGIPPARHRSGRPLKTIAQRLKGKEGRFRYSLAGKRVDFSARTVITPDPEIKIDEVGVPIRIARELTIPERVTLYNKKFLLDIIKNGENYPGANYVIRPDGKRRRITNDNAEEVSAELENEYLVERHLVDGDIVLFNRQPSLHRASIMAHRVRVLPGNTFRLNLCVCSPYNADFDGDEMNLHVPQNVEARAESTMLMDVNHQLRSPRFGGPIIGCIHDHITGAYMLTNDKTVLSRDKAIYLLGLCDTILPDNKSSYTGKEVFSTLLPDDMNLEFKSKYGVMVKIKDGQLISGVIDDKAIGAFSGVILDYMITKYGFDFVADFLNKVTLMAIGMSTIVGITNGLDEEDLPQKALDEIDATLTETEKKVMKIIKTYREGNLKILPGKTLDETLERKIMSTVNKGRDAAGKISESHLNDNNQIVVMAKTGARGNILNITQMSACLGQQAVRGQRINRGYRTRTLPHFKEGDLGSKAHGFVRNSYKSGLDPIEFFFHAMGGRESLTDTAMRTPKSGYLQRRLVNATQDLKVEYDGTVRDNSGMIIQFAYGEDSVDTSKSDWGTIKLDKAFE
ncbi:DNA-directed RNA polymerase subunit A' [Candidatus Undinarchaeota archaeon]